MLNSINIYYLRGVCGGTEGQNQRKQTPVVWDSAASSRGSHWETQVRKPYILAVLHWLSYDIIKVRSYLFGKMLAVLFITLYFSIMQSILKILNLFSS